MSRPAVTTLFATPPAQWGLRGDPVLWQALSDLIGDLPLPLTEPELNELLQLSFAKLVGYPLDHPDKVFIEPFDRGGMSGGYVSPAFWREVAMPLLLSRWAEI